MSGGQGAGRVRNDVMRTGEVISVSFTQPDSAQRAHPERGVRPSVPEDGPAIIALMRGAGLQPHVAPEHLHWKYWRERPDWPGPRSFVLTEGRDLLAHVALVPGTLHSEGGTAHIAHPIDWAARREAVGAGVRVMRHLAGTVDFLLGIGGSRDTLKIMPLLGYRRWGEVTGYVRTIAPLGILRRPGPAWKRPPRIARSLMWTVSAPRIDLKGWQLRRIGADALEGIAAALPAGRAGRALFGRSAAHLGFALACPIVPLELYALERGGRAGGYILLSYAPGQARLADLAMASEDPADWRAAVHAAVDRARARGGIAELAAWSSDPDLAQVLQDCGFHARLNLPIYLRAGEGRAMPCVPLRVQMLDSDAYYLYFGGNELWA